MCGLEIGLDFQYVQSFGTIGTNWDKSTSVSYTRIKILIDQRVKCKNKTEKF